MKRWHQVLGDYVCDVAEPDGRGLIPHPDDAEERAMERWCADESGGGSWGAALRGASKRDACQFAKRVLQILGRGAGADTLERVKWAMDAFAEWECDMTPGPEVVITACEWMSQEVARRWREPDMCWPTVALNVLFCELAVRGYHRLDSREAEVMLSGLVLNSAHHFTARRWGDEE